MTIQRPSRQILVVSKHPELADTIRKAVENRLPVYYVPDEAGAFQYLRENRPDIIVIGYLESQEVLLRFYKRLREGWISRHASLILVELDLQIDSCRILSDENLKLGIGEYTFLSGETSPLFSPEYVLDRLRELIFKKLGQRENKLKNSILDKESFCVTWEQIPGPGAFEFRQETVLENARKAAAANRVCAISIVDNPGGNPAIATEILCSEIRKYGIEPMVHLAFRDRNRNQIESLLFQLAALDVNNLLVLSGDYPSQSGFAGTSKPVFDVDSVNGLQLIQAMNQGLEHDILRRKTRLAPTNFFTGVAFNPNKQQEAEVMGQYYKLKKKIAAGADFAILQIGYDARKMHEVKLWLEQQQHRLPVLTSIQVLTYSTAKSMHANRVPGCVVTDQLLNQIAEENRLPDKGRAARIMRAAKMLAISKGMGFKGTCISGHSLKYDEVEEVLERGNTLVPQWKDLIREFDFPQKQGFYYFEKDSATGLNQAKLSPRPQKVSRSLVYALSPVLHLVLFEPSSPLYKVMRRKVRFIAGYPALEKPFHAIENWTKTALYGCQDCGDCALMDIAYLCPVSQCPKDQRNAPCGGSYEGWCEVYPNQKQCIWVRAYRRLKARHLEHTIGETIVPPCDYELRQTSSWVNYFLGKDHISKRIGKQ
ncbi:MAG TPA: methylenetetrahydrofolate reductase C-terminal domain-containing protein [Dehalococcoidales bacterium]|nr:methylenetetrahydrofolate reductase C-terminal domain-containing protein [Dehalococcoidales bacterium]